MLCSANLPPTWVVQCPEIGTQALKWDPRGLGVAYEDKAAAESYFLPPVSSTLRPQGQRSRDQVCGAYRKVSLRAACSRGSSMGACWGLSVIAALAARLTWRRGYCMSAFHASL